MRKGMSTLKLGNCHKASVATRCAVSGENHRDVFVPPRRQKTQVTPPLSRVRRQFRILPQHLGRDGLVLFAGFRIQI